MATTDDRVRDPRAEVVPSGFFVLRTPLLPFDEFQGWAEGAAEEAPARRRETLRRHLRHLLARPEVVEGIHIASPSLAAAVDAWMQDPEGRQGRKVERARVRYFSRMCTRATPFGLFAGYAVGRLGEETVLRLPPRGEYRRVSRLDMRFLTALADAIGRSPEFREEARYRPTDTLYRAAGRLHYVERVVENGERSHRIAAVDETAPLTAILERAAGGARQHELVDALVERGAPVEGARAYVAALVDARLLTSGLEPPVTGTPALPSLIAQLESSRSAAATADILRDASGALAELDRSGLGVHPGCYEAIAERLSATGVRIEPGQLFQVDMIKPGGSLRLGAQVIAEIERSVERLRCLALPPADPLQRLRAAFQERYENRSVPLLEAFDDEAGIGLDALPPPRDTPAEEESAPAAAPPWSARDTLLLERLLAAARTGATEILLDDAELRRVAPDPLPELPDAFAVAATLAGAPERGEPLVFLHGAYGPSGARMLARFCEGDPELCELVERHLRDEEALDPDAVFAEVAHLPTDRLGNVVRRPLLRDYEIDYLGPSGAPEERRIPLSDLIVSLAGERFVLYSQRLGRRVVPRVSSAINPNLGIAPLFRLLGMMQSQGVHGGLVFKWGPLGSASFLPRLRVGRTVLGAAHWRLRSSEIEQLRAGDAADRFAAVQQLRAARGLPRFVTLIDQANPLITDLENSLSVDSLLDLLADARGAVFSEVPGLADGLCVAGPEGRFVHELLIPFTRRTPARVEARVRLRDAASPGEGKIVPVQRSFPPGSEWLYAKLYGGRAATERVLGEVIVPLCERLSADGVLDGWFFIRYADPHYHLRLRLHGDSAALQHAALPELQALAAGELDCGRIWRFALDTYEREIERYGGPAAIEHVEAIFAADSVAVLAVLQDADPAHRLDAAVLGVDTLWSDLGMDAGEGRVRAERLVSGLRARLPAGALSQRELAAELRRARSALEEARLRLRTGGAGTLQDALRQRSAAVAPHVHALRRLEREGVLSVSIPEFGGDLAHMHINRVLRDASVEDELRIFDRLARLLASEVARQRGAPSLVPES